MADPTDAQVEAAIEAHWNLWERKLAAMGMPSRSVQMLRTNSLVSKAAHDCMRAALVAAARASS